MSYFQMEIVVLPEGVRAKNPQRCRPRNIFTAIRFDAEICLCFETELNRVWERKETDEEFDEEVEIECLGITGEAIKVVTSAKLRWKRTEKTRPSKD